YMGEDTSYAIKNQAIIDRLKEAEGAERSARFVCNIAAVLPDGRVLHTEKTMEGLIAHEPAGEEGFGYDPILYIPEFGKTSAQLTIEEKNRISHRGKALEAMKEELSALFGGE
ncbi:non-canonical purine NTP pyrophosphatase, partial [Phocaeicola vulgatus]